MQTFTYVDLLSVLRLAKSCGVPFLLPTDSKCEWGKSKRKALMRSASLIPLNKKNDAKKLPFFAYRAVTIKTRPS